MEALETLQARHRIEQRDLQSRITNKKKNATKKSRKGINDECAALERDLEERQEQELATLEGGGNPNSQKEEGADEELDRVKQQDTKTGDGETEIKRNAPATDMDAVTDQLKITKIVSFELPTQQPPARPQEQQEGKKRNRQKERMARRAAEQEAAAEAAEQEAGNMTDHRGLERASLERTFGAHGLVEHEIRPDGHCLFSAIADQLAQRNIPIFPVPKGNSSAEGQEEKDEGKGTPPYKVVRRAATRYMEGHPDDFVPFLEEPLESYIPKIRDTAEWGGQLELLALASAYQIEIKVVQNGRTETIQPSGAGAGTENAEKDRTIWLAYYRHGYGLGEHYNSLRKKS